MGFMRRAAMNVSLCKAGSCLVASHAKQMDGPLPTPNRRALHHGTSPQLASALICNLPGSLQQRLQTQSDGAPHPSDILTSLRLKHVGKPAWEACTAAAWTVFVLQTHALCSYESGNFTHIESALCFFLPSYRTWSWLNFHAVRIKCLRKLSGSPPDLMAFDKENAPLSYSYNI